MATQNWLCFRGLFTTRGDLYVAHRLFEDSERQPEQITEQELLEMAKNEDPRVRRRKGLGSSIDAALLFWQNDLLEFRRQFPSSWQLRAQFDCLDRPSLKP